MGRNRYLFDLYFYRLPNGAVRLCDSWDRDHIGRQLGVSVECARSVDHVWDIGEPDSLRAIADLLQEANSLYTLRAMWDLVDQIATPWRKHEATLPQIVVWEQGDLGDPVAVSADYALQQLMIISRGGPHPLPCSGVYDLTDWFHTADRVRDLAEFVEHLIDQGARYVASLLIGASDGLYWADWDDEEDEEDYWEEEEEEEEEEG